MARRPARDTAVDVGAGVRAVVICRHTVNHGMTPPGWHPTGTREARDARGRRNPRMTYAEWIVLWCNHPDCLARVDVHAGALDAAAERALLVDYVATALRRVRRRATHTEPPLPFDPEGATP